MANEKKTVREPSFILALIPIVAMIGFMLYCFRGHSESGYHDAHMPLVLSIVVACIVGAICGHSFKEMLAGMIERLAASMEAVLILCTVGFLVSSFMASGAIPSLIVYGLDLLTPKLFLPVGCILCAIVGMACGSSWTTTATIGLAFLGSRLLPAEMGQLLLPILIAILPVTVLVMAAAGRTTQALTARNKKEEADHD